MRYIKRKDIECDSCGSDAPTTAVAKSRIAPLIVDDRDEYVCEFCHGTMLGTLLRYKHHDPDVRTLAKGLCQALNIIAEKIKR